MVRKWFTAVKGSGKFDRLPLLRLCYTEETSPVVPTQIYISGCTSLDNFRFHPRESARHEPSVLLESS